MIKQCLVFFEKGNFKEPSHGEGTLRITPTEGFLILKHPHVLHANHLDQPPMDPSSYDGELLLGAWPAICRKVPGRLLLTPTRLIHLEIDGPAKLEVELSTSKATVEIAKKRPERDQALARLSNLPESLGGRLVIEFMTEQKWTHLQQFAEKMKGREDEAAAVKSQQMKEAEEEGLQMRSLLASTDLNEQYQYLVNAAGVMTSEQFLEAHSKEIAQNTPLPEALSVDLAPLRVVAAAQRSQESGKAARVGEQDQAAIFKELPALRSLFEATAP